MARAATALAAVLAAAAASAASIRGAAPALYTLDPTFPAPGALLPGTSRVTAVAVLRSKAGSTEVHVAQRNASLPYFVVLDATTGARLRTYNGSLASPHGATADPTDGSLWVTDIAGGHVQQYDPATGALLRAVGSEGTGLAPPQFSAVADIALSHDGDVLTSDGDGGANSRVLRLSRANLSAVQWAVGGAGSAPGRFSSPHSLAYEPASDRVLVADRGNARIQFLDAPSGRVLGQWALVADCGLPSGAVPWGVRVDAATQRALVVDGALGHVYVLALPASAAPGAPPGACVLLQSTAVLPTPSNPHELAIDAATGDVYVALVGVPTGVLRYRRVG